MNVSTRETGGRPSKELGPEERLVRAKVCQSRQAIRAGRSVYQERPDLLHRVQGHQFKTESCSVERTRRPAKSGRARGLVR